MRGNTGRGALVTAVAVGLMAAMSGCTSSAPENEPSSSPPPADPTPTARATGAELPAFDEKYAAGGSVLLLSGGQRLETVGTTLDQVKLVQQGTDEYRRYRKTGDPMAVSEDPLPQGEYWNWATLRTSGANRTPECGQIWTRFVLMADETEVGKTDWMISGMRASVGSYVTASASANNAVAWRMRVSRQAERKCTLPDRGRVGARLHIGFVAKGSPTP